MPRVQLNRSGYPFSRKRLLQFSGGKGAMYDFLDVHAFADSVFLFDDFLGDTINLDNYAVANGGGAAAVSFATSLQSGGAIRATTGTANGITASASLIGPLIWYGDLNVGMEARVRIVTQITSVQFDIGLAAGVPGSNTSQVNDVDAAPTAYGTDFAVLHMNTGQTLTTPAFVTEGSTASQVVTATAAAGVPGWTSGTTPLVDTYFTVRIETQGNMAYCWVNGRLIASHKAVAAGALEGGVAIAPWLYINALNATSKSLDCDYIAIWQNRA